ncbi:MAG: TatD family hydrolase, partial [Thermomicrobiales bacterium]
GEERNREMSSDSTRHQFVDTHAHLSDEQFATDRSDVLERSARVGVSQIVNVAFSPSMWNDAVALSGAHRSVAFTLGVHPNNAGEWHDAVASELRRMVDIHRPAAIGETGIDYYWNAFPREVQIEAFRQQVAIARDTRLPVIIHMRGEVEQDIRTVLQDNDPLVCVFHSFDGSAELAEWIVGKGWYVGVGGLMTRRSARALQDILRTLPLSQLLLETDSPYLAPTGWSEKRNSPEALPFIAAHLARTLDLDVSEVARETTANARRVFGLADLPAAGAAGDWNPVTSG